MGLFKTRIVDTLKVISDLKQSWIASTRVQTGSAADGAGLVGYVSTTTHHIVEVDWDIWRQNRLCQWAGDLRL